MDLSDDERIRVTCTCGATLEIRYRAAGQRRICPACQQPFKVPLRLKPLPYPLPNRSLQEYVDQTARIVEVTTHNCLILRQLKVLEQFRDARKDGMRTLSHILTFLGHLIEEHQRHGQENGLSDFWIRILRGQEAGVVLGTRWEGKRWRLVQNWYRDLVKSNIPSSLTEAHEFAKAARERLRDIQFDEGIAQDRSECS